MWNFGVCAMMRVFLNSSAASPAHILAYKYVSIGEGNPSRFLFGLCCVIRARYHQHFCRGEFHRSLQAKEQSRCFRYALEILIVPLARRASFVISATAVLMISFSAIFVTLLKRREERRYSGFRIRTDCRTPLK